MKNIYEEINTSVIGPYYIELIIGQQHQLLICEVKVESSLDWHENR